MKHNFPFIERAISKLARLPMRWYLTAVLVIGAIARFLYITKADIWHDEGYTMMLIKFNPLEIIERTARDVHPPLYYLVAHAWQFLFGNSELAIRSLSTVCGLLTIVLIYLLIRKLFSENAGRLAGLFVALGPFAVRYSDEARMYSMAALLVTLSSYLLVLALERKKAAGWKLWLLYGLSLAAGLYTHYYVLFIIPVHVGYALWRRGNLKTLLGDKKWWAANMLGAVLFVPWLPTVLAQTSRVSAGFWIPPVTAETLPNTFMQFIMFKTDALPGLIEALLLVAFLAGTGYLIKARKRERQALSLLAAWFLLPLMLVMLLSLKRPIYYDRYFIYCALAFYALLAIMILLSRWLQKHRGVQLTAAIAVCAVFIFGIGQVAGAATHKMGTVGNYVSQHYRPGDEIISAELYTFFDFSYYNHTGQPVYLLSDGPLSGYGETSLIYDRQDQLVVHSLDSVTNARRVWLVGKTGQHDYYEEKVPANWHLADLVEADDSAVRLYDIRPASAE